MHARLAALVAITAMAAGVAGSVPGAPQQVPGLPATFARVESGAALLRSSDCGKKGVQGPVATGFLVGSRVVMTAHEVVTTATSKGCRIQVGLGGHWYGTSSAKAWYDARSTVQEVNLATLELSQPAPGHVFGFARALPRRGATVLTLGHPLGLPLNLQQGIFRRAVAMRGVPAVIAGMAAGEGNNGGPILNGDGEAIGIVSRTSVPEEDPVAAGNFIGGADLAHWFAASESRDLCRAYPRGGIRDCPADSARPGPRRWVSISLRAGTDAGAPRAPQEASVSTETLARVASGVARIRPTDCGGVKGPWPSPPGFFSSGATGFLVGSQVVMTAKHVVPTGCRSQVQLGGRWYETTFAKAWYDSRSKVRDVDLATLKLTRPVPGYVFRFARAVPPRSDAVATIGHPLGLPLNFQRGFFRRATVYRGFPFVIARIDIEGGNSGGPIINSDGDVIGVTSRSPVADEDPNDPSFVGGANLAEWFGASASRDLCRAYPRGGIPDCPTDLARPGPRRWVSLKVRAG